MYLELHGAVGRITVQKWNQDRTSINFNERLTINSKGNFRQLSCL
jgi:hypothetical protein